MKKVLLLSLLIIMSIGILGCTSTKDPVKEDVNTEGVLAGNNVAEDKPKSPGEYTLDGIIYGSPITFKSVEGLSGDSSKFWYGNFEDKGYVLTYLVLPHDREMQIGDKHTYREVFKNSQIVISDTFVPIYGTYPAMLPEDYEELVINDLDVALTSGDGYVHNSEGESLYFYFRSYVTIVKGNWYVFTGFNFDRSAENVDEMEVLLMSALASIK